MADVRGPNGPKQPDSKNFNQQNSTPADKAPEKKGAAQEARKLDPKEPLMSVDAAKVKENEFLAAKNSTVFLSNNDQIRHAIEQQFNIGPESYQSLNLGVVSGLSFAMDDPKAAFDAGSYADFEKFMGNRVGNFSASELLHAVQGQVQDENLA